jgi:hypothetical protein
MGRGRLVFGRGSLLFACLGLLACGESEDPAPGFRVGEQVDLDGDGKFDGVVVDLNGDGIPDGVDTDGDGRPDRGLPNPSAGGGGGGGGGGSGDGCEVKTVRSSQINPDILIVLDRSTSMQMEGPDRWTPSRNAVKEVTSALDQQINFGLMLFPGGGVGGLLGGGILDCSPGRVAVPIGQTTSDEISAALERVQLLAGTPTAATLRAAHRALGSGLSSPDRIEGGKYVLLVTDGAPNCHNGQLGSGFGGMDQAAVDDTVAAVRELAQDGIKTYVIGYDTRNDAALSAALDRMAVAGDTGDKRHRPVEDQRSLQAMLQEIAGGAISCAWALDTVPEDPSFVKVQVDGRQLNLNDPNGWRLDVKDGVATVTVQGNACDTLRSGGDHTLHVEVTCEMVPLI